MLEINVQELTVNDEPVAVIEGACVGNVAPPTGVWGLPAVSTSSASSPKKLILSNFSKYLDGKSQQHLNYEIW